MDAIGGGGGEAVRPEPLDGSALDLCTYMLELIYEVQAARDLRWERGVGVPPAIGIAFGMRDIRLRAIPV